MPERKVNLEEILEKNSGLELGKSYFSRSIIKGITNAMKEACRRALELAAENAETEKEMLPECGVLKSVGVVNKQSILDTINQVE